MSARPRCKKCGKILTDAVSIACGMGPECRGEAGHTHGSTRVHNRRRNGQAYSACDLVTSNAEAWANGEAVTVGRDPATHQPICYIPDGTGRYRNSLTGHISSAAFLQAWMIKYGFLSTPSVAPKPASEAYLEAK